jgi:hypothetical protein
MSKTDKSAALSGKDGLFVDIVVPQCKRDFVDGSFMKKLKRALLCLGIACLAPLAAGADESGIPLGDFVLYPTVGFSLGHTDNVYRAATDPVSSLFTTVAPGLRLERVGDQVDVAMQYDYERTHFSDSPRDDYASHHALASLAYEYSRRTRIKAAAEYFNASDRRGTGLQQGDLLPLGLDPDQWHSLGVSAGLHYGAVGARGSIDVDVGQIRRKYDNNREFTRGRDRKTRYLGLTYGHRLRPKTSLLLQAKCTRIDYDLATLDNHENRLMAGLDWKATGKTSLRALAGYLAKNFDDPAREDYSGIAWELGATWHARSYSVFDLSTTRETDETDGNGSFIVRQNVDFGWNHHWSRRLATGVSLGYASYEYRQSLRDDDLTSAGLSVNYQVHPKVLLGLAFKRYKRNSTVNFFEFDENTWLLSLEAYL